MENISFLAIYSLVLLPSLSLCMCKNTDIEIELTTSPTMNKVTNKFRSHPFDSFCVCSESILLSDESGKNQQH